MLSVSSGEILEDARDNPKEGGSGKERNSWDMKAA